MRDKSDAWYVIDEVTWNFSHTPVNLVVNVKIYMEDFPPAARRRRRVGFGCVEHISGRDLPTSGRCETPGDTTQHGTEY